MKTPTLFTRTAAIAVVLGAALFSTRAGASEGYVPKRSGDVFYSYYSGDDGTRPSHTVRSTANVYVPARPSAAFYSYYTGNYRNPWEPVFHARAQRAGSVPFPAFHPRFDHPYYHGVSVGGPVAPVVYPYDHPYYHGISVAALPFPYWTY
jgi:hypothetical protein